MVGWSGSCREIRFAVPHASELVGLSHHRNLPCIIYSRTENFDLVWLLLEDGAATPPHQYQRCCLSARVGCRGLEAPCVFAMMVQGPTACWKCHFRLCFSCPCPALGHSSTRLSFFRILYFELENFVPSFVGVFYLHPSLLRFRIWNSTQPICTFEAISTGPVAGIPWLTQQQDPDYPTLS